MVTRENMGFPCGSAGKESACSAGDLGSTPGLGRFPCRGAWQPTPMFLPGESHGRRSLAGYTVHGAVKSQKRLATNPFHFHTYSLSRFVLATLKHSIATCGWWQPSWTV